MKVLRSIRIAGHQLVRATLSPNGRLVAFEAHEIGKPRKFVAVYETRKFREVARRKSDLVHAMAFSPDSSLLAFTKNGYTASEPIGLWRIPAA
jgi:hypothetical protein